MRLDETANFVERLDFFHTSVHMPFIELGTGSTVLSSVSESMPIDVRGPLLTPCQTVQAANDDKIAGASPTTQWKGRMSGAQYIR
jgi:hypothetical protein